MANLSNARGGQNSYDCHYHFPAKANYNKKGHVMKYGAHIAHGKPLGQTSETQVKLTGYH